MSDNEEQVRLRIASFTSHFTGLCKLAEECRRKDIKIGADEDFDFMVLCFLEKQREHAMGVQGLIDLEYYRDAGLIVRSMLEGLVQLLWASQDAARRPRLWQEFVYVSDWRKMKKLEKADRVIEPEDRNRVVRSLAEVAEKFYTKGAKKCLDLNRSFPLDPYVNHWMGISYSECFRDVDASGLLDFSYGDISAWHHWDIEGFGEALAVQRITNGEYFEYVGPSLRSGAQALTNGFQCLFQTLAIADSRFDFGIKAKLDSLRESYLNLNGREMSE